MKTQSFIYISMLFIFMVSCVSKKTEISNELIINGYTSDVKEETYYLLRSIDAQDWKHFYKAQDSCIIDSTGHFQFSLNLKSADFFQIRSSKGSKIHENDFYLKPGDSLTIRVNDGNLELKGKAAELNNIALELDQWRVKDENSKKQYANRRYLSHLDFISYVDDVKKERLSIVENYLKQEIPTNYQNYLLAKIHLQWIKDIWDYLRLHNYYAFGNWNYVSADSLGLNLLEKWKPDSNYHFINNYAECIDGFVYYTYKSNKLDSLDSVLWENMFTEKFSIVKSKLGGINRDIGLLNLSQEFTRFLSVPENNFHKQAKIVNNYFFLNKQAEQYYALFEQNYLGFMEIAPSKKAPNFKLENVRDEEVSLSEFIGKVIYIDFWGTWCGPCIKSIPKHLELQKSIENLDDVVFINVALESREEDIMRWKRFISDKYWPGIHLVAKNQFNNEELKPYKLRSAPTYVLIDQEGYIVNPRASGPENILEDIQRLLDN
jgi:thiol-disulfide isomerase/thioredoxin